MIKKIVEFRQDVKNIGDEEMVSVMDFLTTKLNKITLNVELVDPCKLLRIHRSLKKGL